MILLQEKCYPAGGDAQVLPKKEAQDYLPQIPLWTLHQKSLEREFRFKDFKESMSFVKKVGDLAIKEGHQPDIQIFYNKVRLQLSTHSIGGLSLNDFILAAKIDALLMV